LSASGAGESNIGGGEVAVRRALGAVLLFAAIAASFWLARSGASASHRAWVFALYFPAALGLLQAKRRVCVAYAACALRSMGSGREAVQGAYAARLKRAAVWIVARAASFAAIATAAVCLV
jgi:hypothetical protein